MSAEELKTPKVWIEINHDNCPGCHGSLNAASDVDRKACVAFGKKVVKRWVDEALDGSGSFEDRLLRSAKDDPDVRSCGKREQKDAAFDQALSYGLLGVGAGGLAQMLRRSFHQGPEKEKPSILNGMLLGGLGGVVAGGLMPGEQPPAAPTTPVPAPLSDAQINEVLSGSHALAEAQHTYRVHVTNNKNFASNIKELGNGNDMNSRGGTVMVRNVWDASDAVPTPTPFHGYQYTVAPFARGTEPSGSAILAHSPQGSAYLSLLNNTKGGLLGISETPTWEVNSQNASALRALLQRGNVSMDELSQFSPDKMPDNKLINGFQRPVVPPPAPSPMIKSGAVTTSYLKILRDRFVEARKREQKEAGDLNFEIARPQISTPDSLGKVVQRANGTAFGVFDQLPSMKSTWQWNKPTPARLEAASNALRPFDRAFYLARMHSNRLATSPEYSEVRKNLVVPWRVPGAFAGRDVGVAEQVMGTMELAHPGIRPPEKILDDIFSKEIRKQPAVSPYRGVTPVLYENGQKTVPVGISKGAGVGSYLKILRDRFVEARKRVHLTPSLPQIEAGNYSKGHVWMQGLDVTIESPKGSTREGKRPDGTDWKSTMAADYGDIRNYPRSKADGDNMDIFVGPHPSSEIVFVIDQYIDGKFDEHKCMCGFYTAKEARAAYQDSFDDKWKGLGDLTPLTMRQFKQWLQDGDTSKPIAGQNLSKIIKTAVDNSYLPPVIASAFDSKWVQDPAVAIGTGALRGTAIAGIIHAMRTLKRETLDEPKRDLNLTRDLLLGAGIGAGSGALLHYAPEVTSFVHDAIGHPKAAHIMDIPLLPFHAPAAVAPVISAAYGSALGGLKGLALKFKKKLLGEPEEEGELENHIIDGMQSGVNIGIASSMNGRNHVTDAASAAAIAAKGKTTAPRAGPKPVAKPTARNTFSPRIR